MRDVNHAGSLANSALWTLRSNSVSTATLLGIFIADSNTYKGALVSSTAAIGDPTFFLIVVLTTYCPFQGLRSMRGAMLQRLFILLGACGAIGAHIALEKWRSSVAMLDVYVGLFSVGILVLTSFRALCSLWANVDEQHEDAERGKAKAAKGGVGESFNNASSSFQSNSSGAATSFYGQERIRKSFLPLALLVALVYIFVGLPGGHWDRYVLHSHGDGKAFSSNYLVGAGLGYAASTSLAILFGTILQSAAREQRMRFLVTVTLFGLALWEGSYVFTNFHDQVLDKGWRTKAG